MGTTRDCGPHCKPPTEKYHESHCSCTQCHGKPGLWQGGKKAGKIVDKANKKGGKK